MKKFLQTVISLLLAATCFLCVACGGNNDRIPEVNLNVESTEFYTNLIDKLSAIDKYTMEMTGTANDDDGKSEISVFSAISLAKDNFYVASETCTIEKDNDDSVHYQSETYFYIYQNKEYMKDSTYSLDGKLEYEYEVIDFEKAQMGSVAYMVSDYSAKLIDFFNTIQENKKGEISDFAKKACEMFFTASKTDDGYVLALDSAKVLAFYEDLKTLTIKDLIDKYFGENSFQDLKDGIFELLDMTVNELRAELNTMSNNKFDALLEELIQYVLDSEGVTDRTAKETIEEGFTKYGETTVLEILNDLIFPKEPDLGEGAVDLPEEAAPMQAMATVEEPAEQDIKKTLGAIFGVCETSSLFEIIGVDAQTIKEIDDVIIPNASKISLAIKMDKAGELTGVDFAVNGFEVEGESVQLQAKIEFGKDYEKIAEKTAEIQANYNPVLVADPEIWA